MTFSTTETEYMAAAETSKEAVFERIDRDFWHHTGFSLGSLQQSEYYSSC